MSKLVQIITICPNGPKRSKTQEIQDSPRKSRKKSYNLQSGDKKEDCLRPASLLKTCSWKSKMKPVAKYRVYLDILLIGCIYVINIHF